MTRAPQEKVYCGSMTTAGADTESRRFNATMHKFGAPETVIRDYRDWVVLLRPRQCTLGALVLATYEPATSFSGISEGAFIGLKTVVSDLEAALERAFGYHKINYLMLMMVDPDVHFHVVPRYAQTQHFEGVAFSDPGWPGPPDLSHVNETGAALNQLISDRIRQCWS